MTTTDIADLTERLWEAVAEARDGGERTAHDVDSYDVVAAILPIIAAEVQAAKAEALREAAGPEWGNNNTLWSGPRVRAKITRRADRIEAGGSDEHR